MFEFTSLRSLHEEMKKKNEISTTFNFNYNNRGFSCIFLCDITPMLLYFFTTGENPEVFEIEIDSNYMAETYIDDYNKLIKLLGIEYDSNYKFRPVDFFEVLNRNIPGTFQKAANYSSVLRTSSTRRDIEEAEKIYFLGWYENPVGYCVRENNLEKTSIAFGEKIADLSKKTNKSSRWTDKQGLENMAAFNDIFTN